MAGRVPRDVDDVERRVDSRHDDAVAACECLRASRDLLARGAEDGNLPAREQRGNAAYMVAVVVRREYRAGRNPGSLQKRDHRRRIARVDDRTDVAIAQ